jgi:hypothetical protein
MLLKVKKEQVFAVFIIAYNTVFCIFKSLKRIITLKIT